MEIKMNYKIEKEGILQGWNTWDTYCAPCFLYLPGGCGVRLGIKEYLRGQYLDGANIGRRGKEGESVRPGLHAYDGSYTEQTIDWRGLSVHIESAAQGKTLVIRAECLEKDSCFAPALVIEKVGGWKEQGMELTVLSGKEKKEPYLPVRGECICLELSEPIRVCLEMRGEEEAFAQKGKQEEEVFLGKVGEKQAEGTTAGSEEGKLQSVLKEDVGCLEKGSMTSQKADAMVQEKRQSLLFYGEKKYGNLAEAWLGMSSSLAWNLIWDRGNDRPMVNVSRMWNVDRGGFGLFCWDSFFMGHMLSLDVPAIGRCNALEALEEVKTLGFVSNGAMGNGRMAFDRSEPPVGSFCVWEIYQKDPQRWFLEECFEPLLTWNRWWVEHRKNGALLSWGSEPYENKWKMDGIHELYGAALESGLDNSPMYDPTEVRYNKESCLMELWDVGLNAMYLWDCQALCRIAKELDRTTEQKELEERIAYFTEKQELLWNESLGSYCNFKTDTKEFSTVLTPTCFYPLLTGTVSTKRVERMCEEHLLNPEEFYGRWMLPSVSRTEPAYEDNVYWRGRIWAPMNWLVYLGLYRSAPDIGKESDLQKRGVRPEEKKEEGTEAKREGRTEEKGYEAVEEGKVAQTGKNVVGKTRSILAEKSLELFMQEWKSHGHVHENYNAQTGEGDDVDSSDQNYGWGGLLVMCALQEADVSLPFVPQNDR